MTHAVIWIFKRNVLLSCENNLNKNKYKSIV